MNRLAVTLSLAVVFGWSTCGTAGEFPRPNFVVVMVDDLGWSDLGCYGSEIDTPNLDRLAKDGLRFTQFYNTAKCHSSRVCLLTGQYSHQADGLRKSGSGLSRAVTFADVLKAAGYSTAMAGKWHLKGNPTERGFDRYFGHLSGSTSYFRGDRSFRLDGKPWSDFGEDFYTTDANTDWAIRFIEEGISKRKPFLVYLAHNAPHYPLHVREADFRKYEGRYDVGWDVIRAKRFRKQKELRLVPVGAQLPPRPDPIAAWESLSEERQRWESRRMAAYAGMVDRVDQQLGRLLAFLESKRVYENTLILFCSDNGGCPFDRTRSADREPWDPDSYWTYDKSWAWVCNTPWKYYKQNQHEGGISSPFIVHWPGGLKARGLFREPAHLIDVLPTLVELGGGTYPDVWGDRAIRPFDGVSLAPVFRGRPWPGHRSFFFHYSNNRALRRGDWKLVSCTGGAWELYNIAQDRFEQCNLAGQRPDLVAALSAEYEESWGVSLELRSEPGVPSTHGPARTTNRPPKRKKPASSLESEKMPERVRVTPARGLESG